MNDHCYVSQRKKICIQQQQQSEMEKNKLIQQPAAISQNVKLKETPIMMLSNDCLTKIFKSLPIEDRVKIEKVCRKWKELSKDTWNDTKKLFFEYFDKPKMSLSMYQSMIKRKYDYLPRLLFLCGPFLQELNLEGINDSFILSIIKRKRFPNLNCLKLKLCTWENKHFKNFLINMPLLRNLYVQSFIGEKKLPKQFYKALFGISNSLHNLTIGLIEHSKSQKVEKNQRSLNHVTWMKAFSRSNILKSLTLYGYRLSNQTTDAIGNLKSLKNLDIRNCCVKTVTNYYPLLKLTNLELLKIGKSPESIDNFLIELAHKNNNIKSLYLCSPKVSDLGLIVFTRLKKFKNLYLTCSRKKVGGHGITNASIEKFVNMVKFNIKFCQNITDDCMMKVLNNSPQLSELSVVGTSVTEKFIEHAADVMRNRSNKIKLKLYTSIKDLPLKLPEYQSPLLVVHKKVISDRHKHQRKNDIQI